MLSLTPFLAATSSWSLLKWELRNLSLNCFQLLTFLRSATHQSLAVPFNTAVSEARITQRMSSKVLFTLFDEHNRIIFLGIGQTGEIKFYWGLYT